MKTTLILSTTAMLLLLTGLQIAFGDDDDHEYGSSFKRTPDVAAVTDKTYIEECGSCHMVYPPTLLPGRSWQKIMSELDDHFGENAELDMETQLQIEDYLLRASDRVAYRKLFRNLGDMAPMRITELPYFVHEHDEIPGRFIQDNDQVRSLSQCNACHRDAERGLFDEDDVFIAGVGRWDD